jgi:hypothetical protein
LYRLSLSVFIYSMSNFFAEKFKKDSGESSVFWVKFSRCVFKFSRENIRHTVHWKSVSGTKNFMRLRNLWAFQKVLLADTNPSKTWNTFIHKNLTYYLLLWLTHNFSCDKRRARHFFNCATLLNEHSKTFKANDLAKKCEIMIFEIAVFDKNIFVYNYLILFFYSTFLLYLCFQTWRVFYSKWLTTMTTGTPL